MVWRALGELFLPGLEEPELFPLEVLPSHALADFSKLAIFFGSPHRPPLHLCLSLWTVMWLFRGTIPSLLCAEEGQTLLLPARVVRVTQYIFGPKLGSPRQSLSTELSWSYSWVPLGVPPFQGCSIPGVSLFLSPLLPPLHQVLNFFSFGSWAAVPGRWAGASPRVCPLKCIDFCADFYSTNVIVR